MPAVKKEAYLPHYRYDDYLLWEGEWELIDGIAYAMACTCEEASDIDRFAF